MTGQELDLPTTISILTGFVIPLLVGLLSKLRSSSLVKSILNLGLSALASVLSQVIPDEFSWKGLAVTFALTWATSVASYYGLLKPTGASGAVQSSTASFGIGREYYNDHLPA